MGEQEKKFIDYDETPRKRPIFMPAILAVSVILLTCVIIYLTKFLVASQDFKELQGQNIVQYGMETKNYLNTMSEALDQWMNADAPAEAEVAKVNTIAALQNADSLAQFTAVAEQTDARTFVFSTRSVQAFTADVRASLILIGSKTDTLSASEQAYLADIQQLYSALAAELSTFSYTLPAGANTALILQSGGDWVNFAENLVAKINAAASVKYEGQ
jgi:hypothetical protein